MCVSKRKEPYQTTVILLAYLKLTVINNFLMSNILSVFKFLQLSHKWFFIIDLFELGFNKDTRIEFSCSVP